ncbi:unnamed protein product [Dracunculus medinensis]|uniref:NAD(P)-bd_dom domain-containing protein n=1 Tax=Dracunculus medinensis TaxID=318479 RepID=A0A158Q3X2_DRAME|nr:unnamed protein product [Dracunculus medinensis]
MSRNSYLIVGGLGFIGSNIVSYIFNVEADSELTVLDKIFQNSNASRISENIWKSDRFRFVNGDVCNEKLVATILNKYKINIIVSSAIIRESDDFDIIEMARNNLLGLTHLVEAVRNYTKIMKFIYISSEEVYGSVTPKVETVLLKPSEPLAASQSSAEAVLNSYAVSHKIPIIIVRLAEIVYDCSSTIQRFFGVLHVQDAVRGVYACIQCSKSPEIYNFGSAYDLTTEQLQTIVWKAKSRESIPTINLAPAMMNSSKAKSDFNWQPEINLIDGIFEVVANYNICSNVTVPSKNMFKYLIYGENNWITHQFIKMLDEKDFLYMKSEKVIESITEDELITEIIQVAPSHIISFISFIHGADEEAIIGLEGSPHKLKQNLQINLYVSWILANICERFGIHLTNINPGCVIHNKNGALSLKLYSTIETMEIHGFNQLKSSYEIVHAFSQRLLRYYPNLLNIYIYLPVSSEIDAENIIIKLMHQSYISNISCPITVLSDCLPILLSHINEKDRGTLNLMNPGTVRLEEIMEMCKNIIDPNLHYEIVPCKNDDNSQRWEFLTRVDEFHPEIQPAVEALKKCIEDIAIAKKNALKI